MKTRKINIYVCMSSFGTTVVSTQNMATGVSHLDGWALVSAQEVEVEIPDLSIPEVIKLIDANKEAAKLARLKALEAEIAALKGGDHE